MTIIIKTSHNETQVTLLQTFIFPRQLDMLLASISEKITEVNRIYYEESDNEQQPLSSSSCDEASDDT